MKLRTSIENNIILCREQRYRPSNQGCLGTLAILAATQDWKLSLAQQGFFNHQRLINRVLLHKGSNLEVCHVRYDWLRNNGPSFMSLKVPATDVVAILFCVHWYNFECHSVFAEVCSLVCLVSA